MIDINYVFLIICYDYICTSPIIILYYGQIIMYLENIKILIYDANSQQQQNYC